MTELEELRVQLGISDAQVTRWRVAAEDLQQDCDSARAHLAAAQVTIEALQKVNLADGARVVGARRENERLKLQIEELQAERRAAELDWTSTVGRLTEEIDALRLDLARRMEERA